MINHFAHNKNVTPCFWLHHYLTSTVLFSSTNSIFELQRELGRETVNPVLVYTKLYDKKDNKLC